MKPVGFVLCCVGLGVLFLCLLTFCYFVCGGVNCEKVERFLGDGVYGGSCGWLYACVVTWRRGWDHMYGFSV